MRFSESTANKRPYVQDLTPAAFEKLNAPDLSDARSTFNAFVLLLHRNERKWMPAEQRATIIPAMQVIAKSRVCWEADVTAAEEIAKFFEKHDSSRKQAAEDAFEVCLEATPLSNTHIEIYS